MDSGSWGGGGESSSLHCNSNNLISPNSSAGFFLLFPFQAVCDTFKKAVRTLMDEFHPLADDVTHLVVQMYEAVPQQSLLDLAKQVRLYVFLSQV